MYQCISLNAYTPYAVGMECCKLHSSIINNILDTRKRVHHLSILLMTICACAVHEWSYKLCNASQQSNDCLFWFLRCPYSREIKLLVHIFTYRKRRKWCKHAALKHPQIYHLIKLFLFLCFFLLLISVRPYLLQRRCRKSKMKCWFHIWIFQSRQMNSAPNINFLYLWIN